MFPQFKDVVTRSKPSIIFSDGEWELPSADWHTPEILAWLFNDSPVKDEVVVDDRWGKRHAPQTRRLLHHRIHVRHEQIGPSMGGEPRHGLLLWLQPDGDV